MKIIAIVFENKRPWSVVTEDGSIYDVNYCRRDEALYFDFAGNYGVTSGKVHLEGGSNDFWMAKRFEPANEVTGLRFRSTNPLWLRDMDSWGQQSRTEYCKVCDDNLPTEDAGDNLCEHLHWDYGLGDWAGEGR